MGKINSSNMSENLLKQLTKINMLNIIIAVVLGVWMAATLKSVFTQRDLTASAQSTIDGLKNIMLLVLGYYLKQAAIGNKEDSNSIN